MLVVRLDGFTTSFVDLLSEIDAQANISVPETNSTGPERKQKCKGRRIPLECHRHFLLLLSLALELLIKNLYTNLEKNEDFKQEQKPLS